MFWPKSEHNSLITFLCNTGETWCRKRLYHKFSSSNQRKTGTIQQNKTVSSESLHQQASNWLLSFYWYFDPRLQQHRSFNNSKPSFPTGNFSSPSAYDVGPQYANGKIRNNLGIMVPLEVHTTRSDKFLFWTSSPKKRWKPHMQGIS